MLNVFFSSASRKAWAGGVLTALLSPLVTVLSSSDVTWRTALYAILSGIVSAIGVYAVTNEPPGPISAVDVAEAEGDHLADQPLPPVPPVPPPVVHPHTTAMGKVKPPSRRPPGGSAAR